MNFIKVEYLAGSRWRMAYNNIERDEAYGGRE